MYELTKVLYNNKIQLLNYNNYYNNLIIIIIISIFVIIIIIIILIINFTTYNFKNIYIVGISNNIFIFNVFNKYLIKHK